MNKMTLVIAGTSVAIETDEATPFFLAPLHDFFRGFIKKRGPATATLTISYNHLVTHRKFQTSPLRFYIESRPMDHEFALFSHDERHEEKDELV